MKNYTITNKNKMRLDLRLVQDGIFDSREKAKIAIMEGLVFVDNQKEDKPGCVVKNDAIVEFRGIKQKYVSRGGYKLEKAIEFFNLDISNKICLDIGSSTGGFTDCMLQNGARLVYAIDCGTNQLDYKLRIDDRVISIENYNARYLTKSDIDNQDIDFASVDVSFISLTKIILPLIDCLNNNSIVVALIKPQFEAGKNNVSDGIIKNKNVHIDVINNIINFCLDLNLNIMGLTYSPIKGPKGNIEFLICFKKNIFNDNNIDLKDSVIQVVNEAHNCL